jgi:O-antigen ligase
VTDGGPVAPVQAIPRGKGRRGIDAVTLLTIYLVLLFAIPSNIAVAALGSLGRPSLLFGLVLFGWWAVGRLQIAGFAVRPVRQPVKVAYAALLVVALVSFGAALLRGQPFDQVSPAVTSILRLLSWGGVLLVAVDGIRSMRDLSKMIRRLAIAGGLLAALGLAQFVTGQTLTDFFSLIPGLTGVDGGVDARGAFTRSAGTATHPLEYATALSAALPLTVVTALSHGFQPASRLRRMAWWLPVALIAISSFLAVSRSALVGLVVALIATIPALPRRVRGGVVGGAVVLAGVVVVAVPGLFGTMVGLFAGAGSDASTTSRTNGLDRAPEFIATSPVYGNGFGTFLPRYYIFDNQWVLLAVELGVLGVIAFAGMIVAGMWSARHAWHTSQQPDVALIGPALVASLLTVTVLFAFFDGLSFPIAASLPFLLAGLCGAVLTIGKADADLGVTRRAASAGTA